MAADLYQSPGAKPPPYWRSPRNAHISGICPAVSWTELDRPGGSPGLHKCTLGVTGQGTGQGWSQEAPQGSPRQHPGNHKARHPAPGQEERCQEDLGQHY